MLLPVLADGVVVVSTPPRHWRRQARARRAAHRERRDLSPPGGVARRALRRRHRRRLTGRRASIVAAAPGAWTRPTGPRDRGRRDSAPDRPDRRVGGDGARVRRGRGLRHRRRPSDPYRGLLRRPGPIAATMTFTASRHARVSRRRREQQTVEQRLEAREEEPLLVVEVVPGGEHRVVDRLAGLHRGDGRVSGRVSTLEKRSAGRSRGRPRSAGSR